jgi:nucleoside-diphosphate kinase
MSNLQRTLVVLKPDTIWRSIIWEIISRFERAGLHIVAMKMVKPEKEFLHHHYETIGKVLSRHWQKVFDITLKMMMQNPVVAIVIEWVESVEYVRKLVWSTEPKSAAPGTIRWDYAHMSYAYADSVSMWIPNLVHASGNKEEAEEEIKHRFSESDLYSYEPIHSKFTR